jgi:hypothetical protein
MTSSVIEPATFRLVAQCQDFSTKLNSTEIRGWQASENVCRNFLGSESAENYSEILQELIYTQSAMWCNIIETSFSSFPFGFFSLKTWDPSPMNMAKGSIMIAQN